MYIISLRQEREICIIWGIILSYDFFLFAFFSPQTHQATFCTCTKFVRIVRVIRFASALYRLTFRGRWRQDKSLARLRSFRNSCAKMPHSIIPFNRLIRMTNRDSLDLIARPIRRSKNTIKPIAEADLSKSLFYSDVLKWVKWFSKLFARIMWLRKVYVWCIPIYRS